MGSVLPYLVRIKQAIHIPFNITTQTTAVSRNKKAKIMLICIICYQLINYGVITSFVVTLLLRFQRTRRPALLNANLCLAISVAGVHPTWADAVRVPARNRVDRIACESEADHETTY